MNKDWLLSPGSQELQCQDSCETAAQPEPFPKFPQLQEQGLTPVTEKSALRQILAAAVTVFRQYTDFTHESNKV